MLSCPWGWTIFPSPMRTSQAGKHTKSPWASLMMKMLEWNIHNRNAFSQKYKTFSCFHWWLTHPCNNNHSINLKPLLIRHSSGNNTPLLHGQPQLVYNVTSLCRVHIVLTQCFHHVHEQWFVHMKSSFELIVSIAVRIVKTISLEFCTSRCLNSLFMFHHFLVIDPCDG